ncbi:hypothetical protein [Parvularcula sp. LCG005]|uniref:hypothetical protein n=1 Tax=Parvularcula sp. LCG005 TaxID=3078805 RepID=UPI0029437281|nr:hypothetical protein [Parvularcula sp. LCG005]WOI53039.1 hypothetical protein RUI03_12875 [Parvularcula sp. LCG005]
MITSLVAAATIAMAGHNCVVPETPVVPISFEDMAEAERFKTGFLSYADDTQATLYCMTKYYEREYGEVTADVYDSEFEPIIAARREAAQKFNMAYGNARLEEENRSD